MSTRLLAHAAALLLLATGTACGATGGGNTDASCAQPYLDARPPGGTYGPDGSVPSVPAGSTIRVYGHWFTTTCNDTGGHAPLEPMDPVRLELTLPGGSTRDLGTFTPSGDDLGFSTVVEVPAGTPEGRAGVGTTSGEGAPFVFTVAAAPTGR